MVWYILYPLFWWAWRYSCKYIWHDPLLPFFLSSALKMEWAVHMNDLASCYRCGMLFLSSTELSILTTITTCPQPHYSSHTAIPIIITTTTTIHHHCKHALNTFASSPPHPTPSFTTIHTLLSHHHHDLFHPHDYPNDHNYPTLLKQRSISLPLPPLQPSTRPEALGPFLAPKIGTTDPTGGEECIEKNKTRQTKMLKIGDNGEEKKESWEMVRGKEEGEYWSASERSGEKKRKREREIRRQR